MPAATWQEPGEKSENQKPPGASVSLVREITECCALYAVVL